ncbi:hypothetical protein O3M35_008093 [Rhynocoris fuscipes]|uniref:Amidase domain-containing protein n=1 Tax=Rhynocoris fuscipes TaxID=488301 RepID=A0AAW1D5V3_9HEMI
MEVITILAAIQKIIYWVLWPFNYLRSLRATIKLPAITSPYIQMSTVQIAKKIRNGEVRSREVVDAYIERIKAVNPIVNAVVEDRFKEAQEEANRVDDYIAANKDNLAIIENEKPLLGVPFTVKECCRLKGLSLSIGCLPLKGRVATEDGVAVSELRKAGAIPLCVTNTPELAMCWESNNLVTGCTRNPYNVHRTPGGSSGGEGALLGAGASPFGIGSDLGGSIRIPSMFNGIFGLKPTPEIISIEGHVPMATDLKFKQYLSLGPMARYAEDLPLLMKVMSAERARALKLDEKVDLSTLNVYFIDELIKAWYAFPVEDEIKNRMKEAVSYLKTAYGCHTEKSPLDDLDSLPETANAVITGLEGMEDILNLSAKKKNGNLNRYLEILKSIFGLSEFSIFGIIFNSVVQIKMFTKEQYEMYMKENEKFKAKFKDVLKDNGVLLFPTFPKPALQHYGILTHSYAFYYPMIFNALGLPALHVPLGLDRNGLPIGIQVIAGPYQDRLCIAVAKALEERFGGWIPPQSS